MNGTDIDILTEKLASSTVDEELEVSFAGRGLTLDTEEDAAEIVEAIKNCPGMTSLCLEGNTVGIPGAKAIAKALESQPSFRRALWKDMFTRRTENEIPDALQFLSSGIMLAGAKLVELDLSDNAFGHRGLRGLVSLLKSSACYSLKELRLNNNGLGIGGGTMLADALCDCLSNSKRDGSLFSLKLFICGRNRLENEGAAKLSKFLKEIGTLEYIAMPQNGIYHEGIKDLADALSSNPNLKTLNLEDNSLTATGAEYIAKVLPHLKNLEILNFGDCLIRTEGAQALASALYENCPKLKEVLLGYNEMNKEGGLAIAKAMQNKNNLQKLVLNGNQFGESGCQNIEDVMKEYGKSDHLGSLSEDEGAEDEYDEYDEDYNEGDEEDDYVEEEEEVECGDSETSLNKSQDKKSQLKEEEDIEAYISPMLKDKKSQLKEEEDTEAYISPMLKVSPKDFSADPTPQKLLAVKKSGHDLLSLLPEEPTLEQSMDLFMKVCLVVKPDNQEVISTACEYADVILSTAFKKCDDDDKVRNFNNVFLVHLGLIKSEDKKFKAPTDLRGPLIVLEHTVKQNYFHHTTRDILQLFLSRPLKSVEACGKIKHTLMQTLFQI